MATPERLTAAYVAAALDGELSELRAARDGRNNTLFRVAARLYQFAAAGQLDVDALTSRLTDEALALGLSALEIKHTLTSARKRAVPASLPASLPAGRLPLPAAVLAPPQPDPPAAWIDAAGALVAWAQDRLWDEDDETGLNYLARRGIDARTAYNAGLGYVPRRLERSRRRWGLPPAKDGSDAFPIPAGIVIPYEDGRRRVIKVEIRAIGDTAALKKYTLPGSANALWGARHLSPYRPAVLVEGVLNALSVQQAAGDRVRVAAIGAATHARQMRWIALLAMAPVVLVATDAGEAGEAAARYWIEVLGRRAVRWRPYWDDPNAMLRDAGNALVREWIDDGLRYASKE